MAYVIGSQKGKDIAKNLKTGETYKASDGSTWTKKSDGSVSVTHNGQTTNNAYKPTSSAGGSMLSDGNGLINPLNQSAQNRVKFLQGDSLNLYLHIQDPKMPDAGLMVGYYH